MTGWNSLKSAGKYAEMLLNFDSYTDHDLDVIMCANVIGAADSSGNLYTCDGTVCSHANINRYSKNRPGHWEIVSGSFVWCAQGSSTDCRGYDTELSANQGRYTLADFRGYNHQAVAPEFYTCPAQLYGTANSTVSCTIEFNIGEVEWLFNDNSSTAYRARNHYDSLDQYEICAYWKVSGSNSCNVVPLSSASYLGLLNGGKYYSATFSLPVWSTATNYIVGVGVFKKTATTALVASIPGIGTKSVVTSEIQKATFEFDMSPSLALAIANSQLSQSVASAYFYYKIDSLGVDTAFQGEQGYSLTKFNFLFNVHWTSGGTSWYKIIGTRIGFTGYVTYKNSTSQLANKTIVSTWNASDAFNGFQLTSDFFEGTSGKAYVFHVTGIRTGTSASVSAVSSGDAEIQQLELIENPYQ